MIARSSPIAVARTERDCYTFGVHRRYWLRLRNRILTPQIIAGIVTFVLVNFYIWRIRG